MLVKMRLARASICDCGFPLMDDLVRLGKIYTADKGRQPMMMTFICGGCGHEQRVECVFFLASDLGNAGYLPACAFEVVE